MAVRKKTPAERAAADTVRLKRDSADADASSKRQAKLAGDEYARGNDHQARRHMNAAFRNVLTEEAKGDSLETARYARQEAAENAYRQEGRARNSMGARDATAARPKGAGGRAAGVHTHGEAHPRLDPMDPQGKRLRTVPGDELDYSPGAPPLRQHRAMMKRVVRRRPKTESEIQAAADADYRRMQRNALRTPRPKKKPDDGDHEFR